MREKPISVEIEESSDLKVLLKLSDEIKGLFLKLMSTDRRTLRREDEKSYFQGRLQLYSTLYKKCREKFIKIKKQMKENSSYFKEPISFEDLIKDFNWERTVKYSRPETRRSNNEKLIVVVDDDDEDDEDELLKTVKSVSVQDDDEDDDEISIYERRKILTEEFTKLLNNKMKKLFNRTDPTVVADVLTQTIVEFVEKYDEITTKEVLERVYREIQSQNSTKTNREKIQDRVGEEKITEPLEAIIPTTGDSVVLIPVGKKIKFSYNDGVDRQGTVITSTEKSLIVQNDKGIKYPIRPDMVIEIYEDKIEEKVVQSLPEEQVQEMLQEEHQYPAQVRVEEEVQSSTELKQVDEEQNVERVLKPFKEFEKEEQVKIVQSYYNSGKVKCGEIKKQMIADGYIISHYDDVYYPFMKINKK